MSKLTSTSSPATTMISPLAPVALRICNSTVGSANAAPESPMSQRIRIAANRPFAIFIVTPSSNQTTSIRRPRFVVIPIWQGVCELLLLAGYQSGDILFGFCDESECPGKKRRHAGNSGLMPASVSVLRRSSAILGLEAAREVGLRGEANGSSGLANRVSSQQKLERPGETVTTNILRRSLSGL